MKFIKKLVGRTTISSKEILKIRTKYIREIGKKAGQMKRKTQKQTIKAKQLILLFVIDVDLVKNIGTALRMVNDVKVMMNIIILPGCAKKMKVTIKE